MAFIRIEKKSSGSYIRIVKSFKVNGITKHETLYSLGKVQDYKTNELEAFGKKFLELAGIPVENIVAKSFSEIRRVNYGFALILKHLFHVYQLNKLFNKIHNSLKVELDWIGILKLMITERWVEPCSKRQNFLHQYEYIGLCSQNFSLHHIYRTLDILYKNKNKILKHLWSCQQNLFSDSLDLLFYDVTTLYFDSQIVEENSIRQKGYSKDGKAHKTQVVLGLLVDKNRNPIYYQLFPGNTYEGKTLELAIKELKSNYKIENIVIVADSGMLSSNNCQFLENENIDYIIGERIKSLPETIQSELLNKKQHQKLENIDINDFSYLEKEYKGKRIICTYSRKRAEKDAKQREELIKKAEELIKNPGKLNSEQKKGAKRFIIIDKKSNSYLINEKQIEKDKKLEGYKAIITTSKDKVEEIISKYRDLFEVEQAFRTLKSDIEIRPMFHWTNERIEAHVLMCFISYIFINYMRNKTGYTYMEMIKMIEKMQMSEVKIEGNENSLYMRSSVSKETKEFSKKLKIELPNDVTTQLYVNQHFK